MSKKIEAFDDTTPSLRWMMKPAITGGCIWVHLQQKVGPFWITMVKHLALTADDVRGTKAWCISDVADTISQIRYFAN